MDTNIKTILVTGATGRQGGATARHLLAAGWSVRALTRDPNGAAARELAALGATVVRGNLDEYASVSAAIEGCYGVFSVQDFNQAGQEGEVRQGTLLGDLAEEHSIKHFVYTSVCAADKNTGIPHFQTKWTIEKHLRSLNLPSTILRPVFFMDNFNMPSLRESIHNGRLSLAVRRDRSLQMIAVDDIGAIAALVFGDPDRFIGQAWDIAGDELTLPTACRILGRAIGREVRYEEGGIEDVAKASPAMAKMFRWFNDVGYQVDIVSVRRLYPELKSLQAWSVEVFAGKAEAVRKG